jgi:hypothetical protein
MCSLIAKTEHMNPRIRSAFYPLYHGMACINIAIVIPLTMLIALPSFFTWHLLFLPILLLKMAQTTTRFPTTPSAQSNVYMTTVMASG